MAATKSKLLSRLLECAVLLEVRGDNVFRCRAYENGARALEGLEGEPVDWIEGGILKGVKGVGKGMIEHVEEWVRNGELEIYEELRGEIPDGIPEMLGIPGVGAKKVRYLWQEEGIDSLEALQAAAEGGAIAEMPGFGKKSAEKILVGIEMRKKFSERHRLGDATARATVLIDHLSALPEIDEIQLAGSLRRKRETIKDLDVVVVSKKPEAVMEAFIGAPEVERVVNHGPTKSSVVFEDGIPADLRVVKRSEFAAALNYFTGSKEHNTHLRGRAKGMGLRLNEYGLFKGEAKRSLPCPNEAAIYKHLGLAYVEPELREDTGEIEAAEEGKLPELIQEGDMRGLLHCHSTYSDGKSTLREMVGAAKEAGFAYFGICDHSQTAGYAGGLKEKDVLRQHKEIDRLNEEGGKKFAVLKGIESDILGDGSLDYPDTFLNRFDFVVVSIHGQMSMPREKMTDRICKALEHPAATIFAHPSGRLLLKRDPYELDYDRVFKTAAEHRVAIEINANPHRLDLDWRYIKQAKRAGCFFSVNPDAHHTSGIENIKYGIGIARKGWLGPGDVINTFTLAKFRRWLKDRGQPQA